MYWCFLLALADAANLLQDKEDYRHVSVAKHIASAQLPERTLCCMLCGCGCVAGRCFWTPEGCFEYALLVS